jgi:polysaccharide biosynthesis/export protein
MKLTSISSFAVSLSVVLMGATAVFAQDAPRPLPTIDQTNLPQQPIGKQDMLGITVYDEPALTRTVRVNEDGSIRLPMLSSTIKVEGMMPAEVEVAIRDQLIKEQLLVDPFVTVNVAEYHSHPISINGAVKTPTTFQAIGNVNLLDALAKGGGLAPEAGGEIIITRPNGTTGVQSTQRIPVRSLIDGSDPQLNVKLTGGEEIRVPVAGMIVVSGNVKESGVFPVQDGGTTTVMTAIAQAKGLGDFQPKMVYIFRPDEQGTRHEIAVDLKAIKQRKIADVVLQPKDLLYVPDNNRAKNWNQVLTTLVPLGTAATSASIYVLR